MNRPRSYVLQCPLLEPLAVRMTFTSAELATQFQDGHRPIYPEASGRNRRQQRGGWPFVEIDTSSQPATDQSEKDQQT